MSNHYVDNKRLYEDFKVWKENLEYNPAAVMPDYVAESIMKIANNLSRRYNFSGYTATWRDEMIGDGIEHCLRYAKNFDHIKYNNPHTYITRICFNAFVQRIKKERKQTAVKYKFYVNNAADYEQEEGEHRVDPDFYYQMLTRLNDYEKPSQKAEKETKTHAPPLGAFYE